MLAVERQFLFVRILMLHNELSASHIQLSTYYYNNLEYLI